MQNADALLEICTELCMLAHFSDKVIDQNLLNDQADLASLFYGLRAASCQARHLITHQFPEHRLIPNGEEGDDVLTEEGSAVDEEEVTKLLSDRPSSQHAWIAEVLFDIATYARENQLQELSAEVGKLGVSFATQLTTNGRTSFSGVTLEGNAANYVSFICLKSTIDL